MSLTPADSEFDSYPGSLSDLLLLSGGRRRLSAPLAPTYTLHLYFAAPSAPYLLPACALLRRFCAALRCTRPELVEGASRARAVPAALCAERAEQQGALYSPVVEDPPHPPALHCRAPQPPLQPPPLFVPQPAQQQQQHRPPLAALEASAFSGRAPAPGAGGAALHLLAAAAAGSVAAEQAQHAAAAGLWQLQEAEFGFPVSLPASME